MATLYEEMYGPLLAYSRSVLGKTSLAEEAVQDTFRIACGKVKQVKKSPNPKGWLVVTLKNVMRNMEKTQARMHTYLVATVPLEEAIGLSNGENEYYEVEYSDLISKEDFALVKAIVVEGQSMLETAQQFDISLEACRKRLWRAKQKMRTILEDCGKEGSGQ